LSLLFSVGLFFSSLYQPAIQRDPLAPNYIDVLKDFFPAFIDTETTTHRERDRDRRRLRAFFVLAAGHCVIL
jgi:hypothetical protein